MENARESDAVVSLLDSFVFEEFSEDRDSLQHRTGFLELVYYKSGSTLLFRNAMLNAAPGRKVWPGLRMTIELYGLRGGHGDGDGDGDGDMFSPRSPYNSIGSCSTLVVVAYFKSTT